MFAPFPPSKAWYRLASSLSTRPAAEQCPWLPTQPVSAPVAQAPCSWGPWLGCCGEPAGSSSLCQASRMPTCEHHVLPGRLLDGVPPRGQLGPKLSKPAGPAPSVTQSSGLPSLQPRGMSQLRMPARERAPGWEQRAGGGSWRPCDRWRLCVSQGRAGSGSFLRSI